MEPEIEVDDLIIIKKSVNYKENDIVTYKTNESYITHRIIEISENRYITKGDNNNTEDEPIILDQIQGKVIKKIKGIGKIINFKAIQIISIFFISILFIFIIIKK